MTPRIRLQGHTILPFPFRDGISEAAELKLVFFPVCSDTRPKSDSQERLMRQRITRPRNRNFLPCVSRFFERT